MSENMIGTIEVLNKNFIINWPFNQNDIGFDPHRASAILLNDSDAIDFVNYVAADIYPIENTVFTSEAQVIAQAERAILEQLAVDFLTNTHSSRHQIAETALMVKTWTNDDIEAIFA